MNASTRQSWAKASRKSQAVRRCALTIGIALAWMIPACTRPERAGPPELHWYVFDEPSGAFQRAAEDCSGTNYRIAIEPLPRDADQQREQLARRLAASDPAIDLIGMDVIWTGEFASAGWLWPLDADSAQRAVLGRFPACVETARYDARTLAFPFTTNAQLLWYRRDRVARVPETWDELIDMAETLKVRGAIQLQGDRYEGLTVFFLSLLASGGGSLLDESGSLSDPTGKALSEALRLMRRLGNSSATDPGLSRVREDEARLAFESGGPTFMINYPFVWPSARANAPGLAAQMGWARWPAVEKGRPSRVMVGGVNVGVSAYSRYPDLALAAAECLTSIDHQRLAAALGGLPPTLELLYDDPDVREALPFSDVLLESLRDADHRPLNPAYSDLSLAIARALHPMRLIDPGRTPDKLRRWVGRALRSEGLL